MRSGDGFSGGRRQLAAWRRQATEFANLYVSVNLSGIQLYSGDIVERVGDILAIHGLDGRSSAWS